MVWDNNELRREIYLLSLTHLPQFPSLVEKPKVFWSFGTSSEPQFCSGGCFLSETKPFYSSFEGIIGLLGLFFNSLEHKSCYDISYHPRPLWIFIFGFKKASKLLCRKFWPHHAFQSRGLNHDWGLATYHFHTPHLFSAFSAESKLYELCRTSPSYINTQAAWTQSLTERNGEWTSTRASGLQASIRLCLPRAAKRPHIYLRNGDWGIIALGCCSWWSG